MFAPRRWRDDFAAGDIAECRADTIKRYLSVKYGVNGTDLVTVGFGNACPRSAGDDSPR